MPVSPFAQRGDHRLGDVPDMDGSHWSMLALALAFALHPMSG
jgi:hypothetical protein